MNTAIKITNLSKSYGNFLAIDNVSLTIDKGDFFALLGPNGAGKTTTINAVTGLANFHGGSIEVFGHNVVTDYRHSRREIGLCGQEFNFDPFLNIFRLLVYQAGYFGMARSTAQDRAELLLKRFKLWDKKKNDFRALSGGMKRRLLICRALIHNPNVLILDEPTAGADLELKYMIWDYLKDLNREGKTILLTSHYMEEVEALCKSIAIIDKGKLITCGDRNSVLKGRSLENVFLELTRVE